VNGTDRGVVNVERRVMGKFVTDTANQFGIRTFTVYLDGNKATTRQAGEPLTGVAKVEIVAKDARGGLKHDLETEESLEQIVEQLKQLNTIMQAHLDFAKAQAEAGKRMVEDAKREFQQALQG
jgi:hypothetical protein